MVRQRKQTACWQLCCSTPITGGVDPRRAFRARELPSKPERPLNLSMPSVERRVNTLYTCGWTEKTVGSKTFAILPPHREMVVDTPCFGSRIREIVA